MNNTNHKNILFAGEGGQGVQKIAQALNNAASVLANLGYYTTYINSFGVEQRGSPSIAYIKISKSKIEYPRFQTADICLVMRDRAIPIIEKFISPNTDVIFDSSAVSVKQFPKRSTNLFGIPATKYAIEKFHLKSYNILLFGVVAKMLEIDQKIAWDAILNVLGDKFPDAQTKKVNLDAYLFGREAVLEKHHYSEPIYGTKKTLTLVRNKDRKAKIVPRRCKGCYICVLKCPVKALKPGSDLGVYGTPVPNIDINKCIACGNCRCFCPDSAISVEKIG